MNQQDKRLVSSILLGVLLFSVLAIWGVYTTYGYLVLPKVASDTGGVFEYRQKIRDQAPVLRGDYLGQIESIKSGGEIRSSGLPLSNIKDPLTGPLVLPFLSREMIISLTNSERSASGLNSLRESQSLNIVASKKLEEMFRLSYFEHLSPTGESIGDVARQSGYQYASIGENLAQGYFFDEAELVMAWMASPGHRENILGQSYREIGVAVRVGVLNGQETILAVSVFAKPLSACVLPNLALKEQISANQTQIENLENDLKEKKAEIDQNKFAGSDEREAATSEYNQMVESFNNLIKVTEASVSAYNQEVGDYNYCLNH